MVVVVAAAAKEKEERMENGGGGGGEAEYNDNNNNKEKGGGSYRYWVREATADAAPLPLPKKLSPQELLSQPSSLGSAWNSAGTWEEKNLNNWATQRIKELLASVGSLEFSAGKAEIADVSRCSGDAFLVIVRNKKRVGYTYELTLKIKGEWIVKEEKRVVKGNIDFPEFSFGELDDLQMQVQLNEEKDLSQQDKQQISQDLKLFLQPVRAKLLQFEQELKDR
ncbi:unnamed protein product [Dovyalis caffra]|uniref:Activator of Hsp90 ATPase AHSA1-like N-terminal domain-containing protein n=1 Tax=Dovyalis caffra TaxID=77055 RepID=A0AAV1S3I2_9ROSI|nr:unnamed protein product [Dovyalis caffra]